MEAYAQNQGWSQLKQECVKSDMKAKMKSKISTADKNAGGPERSIVSVYVCLFVLLLSQQTLLEVPGLKY